MSQTAPLQPITEEDIAQFLVNTPGFFDRHADLLAAVQLTSPHTGRAVSLLERQVEILRERQRQLEWRHAEMVRHGHENTALLQRLHRWTCELLAVPDPTQLPACVVEGIQRHFEVPQAALKIWGVVPAGAAAPFASGVSDEARAFAESLREPYCGPNPAVEALQWLPEPERAASVALVPLRRSADAPALGLLVLASDDPRRFQANAGTDLLRHLAEQAAAALGRLGTGD